MSPFPSTGTSVTVYLVPQLFAVSGDGYGFGASPTRIANPPRRGTALRRGLRKRCPHCGEGRLFAGWVHLERCSVCGLVFVRHPGDTWAFTIIGDRLPIAAMIVLIYFGVARSHRVLGLTLLIVLAALVIWTAPNRWGAGIALHYLTRVCWPDPADPIPPRKHRPARSARTVTVMVSRKAPWYCATAPAMTRPSRTADATAVADVRAEHPDTELLQAGDATLSGASIMAVPKVRRPAAWMRVSEVGSMARTVAALP